MSLFEDFLKVLSLLFGSRIRIRIRIRVTSRIRIRINVMQIYKTAYVDTKVFLKSWKYQVYL